MDERYVSGEGLFEDENMAHLAWLVDSDPITYEEAEKNAKWRKTMNLEIESIERNNTWELIKLASGGKMIRVKWVYKTKLNENGEVEKYKACLVAKGYSYGVDYAEVFAPVARLDTLTKDEDGVMVDITMYKQIVGSLMYLITIRPDIMFVVSLISRYMERPTELHLQAAKRVLRYLKGTIDFGLFYKKGGNEDLIGYMVSDYAGD
ncbi:uncharacterized protein [Malus domestica]|uniref:uncharacterized protein n=1 Tax=Malus domestica TaxID=3750 RepID=UPI003974CC7B